MTSIETQEHLLEEWRKLHEDAPPILNRKPTPQELSVRQEHKQRVKDFFNQLSAQQQSALPKYCPSRVKKPKEKKVVAPSTSKKERFRLEVNGNKRIYWWTKQEYAFSVVVPFCSHRKRSQVEMQEDELLGINRCVFSNLFVDSRPLKLPPPPDTLTKELLGHASLFETALCAESFYMAAKCKYKCDAMFIMKELTTKSIDVACFGHHAFKLTNAQKDTLIKLGANPTDFLQVQDTDCDVYWLRGANGQLPIRDGWNEIRHKIFLYVLRIKFGGTAPSDTQAHATRRSLIQMIQQDDAKIPFMVEHRRLDSFWGDGLDGTGSNVLGKILTQIMLENAGRAEPLAIQSCSMEELSGLYEPNHEIVQYTSNKNE